MKNKRDEIKILTIFNFFRLYDRVYFELFEKRCEIEYPSIVSSFCPTPGQGSAWLMETQPRESTIAAGLQGSQNESGEVAWGVLLRPISRRRPLGEDFRRYPGGRHATPTAATGRLTPLSCACSGTPLALFSPVSSCHQIHRRNGRGVEGKRNAQHPCFFIRRRCGILGLILSLPLPTTLIPPPMRPVSKERNNKGARYVLTYSPFPIPF